MAKRILVADDSVTIQRAFVMTFAAENVTITSARSADEGLALARQSVPDLVIADATMPGRSGYDLCAALKADRALANVPVYILASPQTPFDEGRARQVGAQGHFLKPFDSGALIERVHEVLRKADGSAGAPSRKVGSVSPVLGIPVPPPDATYDEDEYGEITIDAPLPARVPAPVTAPVPPPAQASPALASPAVPPPVRPAPGVTAASGAPPASPGLRPSLIPGVRPGATPTARPGIVPSSQTLTRQPVPGPSGGHAHGHGVPAALSPTGAAPVPGLAGPLRPASMPTARTMVGMPVPRPGLSLPVPTPPARPGSGPVRTLSGGPAPVAAPAGPAPAGTHAQPASNLVERKMAEIAARGPEYEVLAKLSREVIEKIVWEIVPELTEAIVREELQKRRA